jgi:hypothetical protein
MQLSKAFAITIATTSLILIVPAPSDAQKLRPTTARDHRKPVIVHDHRKNAPKYGTSYKTPNHGTVITQRKPPGVFERTTTTVARGAGRVAKGAKSVGKKLNPFD